MEMKPAISFAIVGAVLLTATIAHPTKATTTPNATLTGFSIQLAADPEALGHAVVRRGSDGFLHLQSFRTNLDRANSSAANAAAIATPRPDMMLNRPLLSAYITVGTGRGTQVYLFKVDPSSTMTWMQCKGCNPHSPQEGPLFDTAASPTFHNVLGSDPYCQPPFRSVLSGQACAFQVTGPGSMSVEGYLGHDQLIHDGNVHQLVHFGCAHKAIHFQNINRFAGVIGVANLARGLTRFSYCLFADGEATRQGFLRFGTDVPPNLHYRSTRILPVHGAHESGHYVSLVGVSVGVRRLGEIRPETFAHHEDGQGGCVIDLDTPLMVLAQEAYDVVEEAVWSDLRRHGAERVKRPGYGLCVRASEVVMRRHLPSMSLHFAEEEAVLVVSPEQLFFMVDDEQVRVACLAVMPGRRTVIGALQQVDTRFIFDLKDSKLSFAPESCIQDSVEAA
nr:unnamed protein product [Digitaria exilis]